MIEEKSIPRKQQDKELTDGMILRDRKFLTTWKHSRKLKRYLLEKVEYYAQLYLLNERAKYLLHFVRHSGMCEESMKIKSVW